MKHFGAPDSTNLTKDEWQLIQYGKELPIQPVIWDPRVGNAGKQWHELSCHFGMRALGPGEIIMARWPPTYPKYRARSGG